VKLKITILKYAFVDNEFLINRSLIKKDLYVNSRDPIKTLEEEFPILKEGHYSFIKKIKYDRTRSFNYAADMNSYNKKQIILDDLITISNCNNNHFKLYIRTSLNVDSAMDRIRRQKEEEKEEQVFI
jgi:hypothetical protein